MAQPYGTPFSMASTGMDRTTRSSIRDSVLR